MKREEIEQQAELAQLLSTEGPRACGYCFRPMRGFDKLGTYCSGCRSKHAIPADPLSPAFFSVLYRLYRPTEGERFEAHALGVQL